LFSNIQAGNQKELRLIIKSDVQGSLEPITSSLTKLNEEQDIAINILQASAGNINEGDITLAAASDAIVIGFNVQPDIATKKLADNERISIRQYSIIYRLIEDIEKALKGMLEPEYVEVTIGKARVQAVFKISKVGYIAGCKVIDGEIHRNAKVRVRRGTESLVEGDIHSLKHEKDDVKEVRNGFECGIAVKNFTEFEDGDIIECFRLELAQN
ncbi:MAG: translation initiation factor IF-2, partial [Anaerolineaceae bacterium]|nr:translation initiation factor IF-2 [Anaerolineaceae bacterium]